MAYLRGFLIMLVIGFFFLVGAPVQALLARYWPRSARRMPLLFCKTLLVLLRVSVETTGAGVARGPAVLLVVNHVSWIDILVMGGLTPFCFLAKSEVARWPVIAAFARVQGTVFIDRARRRAIPPANAAMAARMREGRAVLLFPEGTTHDGVTLGHFHASHYAAARDLLAVDAAREAVMVQPVALAYSSPLAPWVGDDTLLAHLWRVLRGAPMRCHVVFGAPIPYTRWSDRKVVARLSRATIEALLENIRSVAFRARRGETSVVAARSEPASPTGWRA
jgi:1-acyl-sn-glycerol-3-phosphate acyltransferase